MHVTWNLLGGFFTNEPFLRFSMHDTAQGILWNSSHLLSLYQPLQNVWCEQSRVIVTASKLNITALGSNELPVLPS